MNRARDQRHKNNYVKKKYSDWQNATLKDSSVDSMGNGGRTVNQHHLDTAVQEKILYSKADFWKESEWWKLVKKERYYFGLTVLLEYIIPKLGDIFHHVTSWVMMSESIFGIMYEMNLLQVRNNFLMLYFSITSVILDTRDINNFRLVFCTCLVRQYI